MVNHVPKKYRKLFQDSITVTIPLNVTADLGVAIRHTREKRVKALQREFPSLKRESKNKSSPELEVSAGDNGTADEEEDEKDRSMKPQSKKSRPGVMQREQYGSVVDYLEAKYCRGVMLEDDDEDDDDDEKGSVYESDNSFVDDSLLKRDLAGQVLSQATHTKLELQNDDDDFFVNVGNLEVEDNDFMDYDPLVDEEKDKKAAAKRKRSKSTDSKGAAPKKPKAKNKEGTNKPNAAASKEAAASDEDEAQVAVAASGASGSDTVEIAVDLSALQKTAAEQKAQKDSLYDRFAQMAKGMSNENFPRKKLTVKMSIVVPEDKGPGDKIAFTNPHAPGQKMVAQIPENKGPGDKIFVNVVVPPPADVTENKFPRDFQDLIADYAAAYDDWCDSEAKYHEADPEKKGKFKIKQAKMAKFDELLEAFPNDDLVVPVDGEELRKILRRVRQNRAKRKRREGETGGKADDAASAKGETEDSKPPAVKKLKIEAKPLPKQKLKKRPSLPEKDEESSKPAAKPRAAAKPKPDVAAKPKAAPAAKKPKAAPKPRPQVGPPSETISVRVPGRGTVFPEFEMGSIEEFG